MSFKKILINFTIQTSLELNQHRCVCAAITKYQSLPATFIKHVRETTEITDDKRVEMKMPWKSGYPEKLPNNFIKAYNKLLKLEEQLSPEDLDSYNSEFQDLFNRGCVQFLSPEEATSSLKVDSNG